MALYQCIKIHLSIFNTLRDILLTSLLLQKLGWPSINVSYQVSFNSLLYFQRYALGKLFIEKNKKGSNPVNTGEKIMVLAFCNSPYGPLSLSQTSLNYLNTFRDMLQTSLLLQKLGREITLITCDRVMVALPHGPLSMYQASLNYLQYFYRKICSRQKCDGWTDGLTVQQFGFRGYVPL